MNAKAESLRASLMLTFLYAALFSSIISLMLLLANVGRNGNPQDMQHHTSIRVSR